MQHEGEGIRSREGESTESTPVHPEAAIDLDRMAIPRGARAFSTMPRRVGRFQSGDSPLRRGSGLKRVSAGAKRGRRWSGGSVAGCISDGARWGGAKFGAAGSEEGMCLTEGLGNGRVSESTARK
jgi:hypothetical protein